MKKIFTLTLGLMLTVAMFAADRRPMVTITSSKRYQVVIDGRQYFSNGNAISMSNLFAGSHDMKVYAVKPGFFMRSKQLVASSCFQVNNDDVLINIDRFGQVQITESRPAHDWKDHDHKGNDRNYGHEQRDHDKRF